MQKETVRLGIVGVRNIGRGHIRRAQPLENVCIEAIADTDAARLAETAAEFDVPRQYSEAEALFADPALDGVILAVPNFLHAEMTIQALEASKHVLVEKPMARTADEAAQMIRAREANERILMVGMNQRFTPLHYGLKAQLDAGIIGEIYYGKTQWIRRRPGDGLWGRGDWFLDHKASGGGPMVDLGVHRLDLALYMMGFPEIASVTGVAFQHLGPADAARRGKTYGIEDAAVALIRFVEDKALLVEASYLLNTRLEPQDTDLYATEGGVVLAGGVVDLFQVDERDDLVDVLVEPDPHGANSSVEHFVNVIRGDESLIATAEQGLILVKLIEAIYHSAETGEMITF
jgi:predicted dehydrogenase